MIYDNYGMFVEASDVISSLNCELDALDSDLARLQKSTAACTQKFGTVHQQLGPKWQEIKKLAHLESDLAKLKHLQDLPSKFKEALSQFNEDLQIFEEPLDCYQRYAAVLNNYKSTKFMVSFHGEIKSYVSRIKSILVRQSDKFLQDRAGQRIVCKLLARVDQRKLAKQILLKTHLACQSQNGTICNVQKGFAYLKQCSYDFKVCFATVNSESSADVE